MRVSMDVQHLELAVKIVLAGTFLFAGFAKLVRGTAEDAFMSLQEMGLPTDRFTVRVMVRALPALEVGLGISLVSGWNAIGTLIGADILLLGFGFVITGAIARGYEGSCFCFGNDSELLGVANLSFNLLLVLGTVPLIVREIRRVESSISIFDVAAADIAVAGLCLLWLFAIKALVHSMESVRRALKSQLG